MRVVIYHNEEARFEPYRDGQSLELALSYQLVDRADRDARAVAEDAFVFFNADLEILEPRRDGGTGEVLFLAACVYRLLGRRSLSVRRRPCRLRRGRCRWRRRRLAGL